MFRALAWGFDKFLELENMQLEKICNSSQVMALVEDRLISGSLSCDSGGSPRESRP